MAKKQAVSDEPKATNDAYTGMLAVSLIALIVGCVLLYLDYSQYGSEPPPAIPTSASVAQPAPAAPPPAQPPVDPANPMPGGANPMPMPPQPAPMPPVAAP